MQDMRSDPSGHFQNDDVTAQIHEIRGRFVNACLVAIAIVALPAVAASMSRIPDIGFIPPMALHLGLAILAIGFATFRRRIAYGLRAGLIITIFFLVGATSLVSVGMISASTIYLAAGSIFAFLLFGMRWGIIALAASMAGLLVIFWLSHSGAIQPGRDPQTYFSSIGAWVAAAGGLLLVVASIGTAITTFYRQLGRSLRREAAERQRLDHLIASAPDSILIANSDGAIIQANHVAGATFGYPETDLAGTQLETIIPGVRSMWPSGLAINAATRPAPPAMAGRRRDGTSFPADITLGQLPDTEDTVVVMVHDLSERQALQNRLFEGQKLEAMGQLTGGMAHDFNNFLASIVGSLELIDMSSKNPGDIPRHIDRAKRAAMKAADLTNSLLAFAQRRPLEPKVIDLAAHIKQTVVIIRPGIGATVSLGLDVPSDLWPIRVDTGQLDSAILNLATNARDAMPDGGQIQITLRNEDVADGDVVDLTPGSYVTISVSDTGTGMTDDVAARAFEPFYTTKDVGRGTGLGLSMVHGFVAQSGGKVEIDRTSLGITVRLYLPRSLEAPVGESDEILAMPEAKPATPPTPVVAALVVEDDEDVREVVATMFADMGYDVIETASGDLALPLIEDQEQEIGLLFTDVVMDGDVNGIELAIAARAARPGMPIVLTSGYPGDLEGRRDLPEDIQLLRKPYLRPDLEDIIRRALTRH